MGAASRAFSAGRKPPKHAPSGTIEGGQFIGRASITHALIRKLLGLGEGGGHGERGGAQGRFTTRGGSVVSVALPHRAPRADDRVRDPKTGHLGTVLTVFAPQDTRYFRPAPGGGRETTPRAGELHAASARVRWDDGRVESRRLDELGEAHPVRPLPDPKRTFGLTQGPEPAAVDTAVTTGTPGRARTAAERMRDAVAAGRVDADTGTRLMRGESPTSIVDSRSAGGFRDRELAKLSAPQRSALEGMDADSQELYWARRAAGQDHDKAIGGLGAAAQPAKVATQWGMATPGPLTDAQSALLKRLDRGVSAVPDTHDPDLRELHARGLVSINMRSGTAQLTGRGLREAGGSVPTKAAAKMARAKAAVPRPTRDVAIGQLRAAGTEAEAAGYLRGLGLSVAEYRSLAADLDVPLTGRSRDAIIKDIVKVQVGGRLLTGVIARALGNQPPLTKAAARMVPGQRANASKVRADILALDSNVERSHYLHGLGLSDTQMRTLAKDIGVGGAARSTHNEAALRIVQHLEYAGERPPAVDSEFVPQPAPTKAAAKMARAKAGKPFDVADIHARLAAATSREEGAAALRGLTVAQLRQVSATAGAVSKNKTELTEKIVAQHVSGRLGFAAMIAGNPSDPSTYRAVAPAAALPEGPSVPRSYTFEMGPDVAQRYGRSNGDEPLYLPNRGADQGLVHLDSQLGGLWSDLVADKREPNSVVNRVARIGEGVGTGEISLDDAASQLRALASSAQDQGVARRIETAVKGITEPGAARIDVPSNVPPSVRRWLDELARIPTMRKTDLPGNRREQSALDEAQALVREISQQGLTGQRTFSAGDAENRLLGITQNLHESVDGVYQARRITGRTFAGPTIVTGYRTGPNGRPEEITEPNPDWPAIRDWLRGVAPSAPAQPAPLKAAARMKAAKAARPRLTPGAADDLAEELSRAKPSREQLTTRLAGYNKTDLASLARAHRVEIPARADPRYKALTADQLRQQIIDRLDWAYRHPESWR